MHNRPNHSRGRRDSGRANRSSTFRHRKPAHNSAYLVDEETIDEHDEDDELNDCDDDLEDEIAALADKFSSSFEAQTNQDDENIQEAGIYMVKVADDEPSSSFPPPREGNSPHFLYPAVVQTEKDANGTMRHNRETVFLDSGSGPSWIKLRCVRHSSLTSFASRNPTRISGVGKGTYLVTKDVTMKIGLMSKDGSVCWTETTAGIVPDDYAFPCDILLGRSIHQKLEIRYRKAGIVEAHDDDGQVKQIDPVPDVRVHLIDDNSVTNPEVQIWKTQFPSLFDDSTERTVPPKDHGVRHAIDVGDSAPVNLPLRTYSPGQIDCLEEFVSNGLNSGIIRESDSPWSSPALVVPKKDGRFRMCIDYRALNRITRRNAFPLANANMQIQRSAGHNFYTALDLKDGFWQIGLREEDIEKTAFTTHDGHFEWLVMPFGLTNAPATFESTLRRICYPFRHFMARLLDDVLIFSQTREAHREHVGAVLKALYEYGFVLQTKKCHWFVNCAQFLGFVIDQTGIRPDPLKVQAIAERPPPSNITELRSFLNAAGYLRHFIHRFAGIANPLYEITKGSPRPGSAIQFTQPHLQAFNALKQAILSSPVLKPIKFGHAVVIDTDASLSCIGAVLQQAHENTVTHLSELQLGNRFFLGIFKMAKKVKLKLGPVNSESGVSAASSSAAKQDPIPPAHSNSSPPETKIENLLRDIDGELNALPKAGNLSSLFHSLKTELVGVLFKSIHRVEARLPSPVKSYAAAASSPAPEKPVPSKELREIQINRRDLSPEEETKTPAELLTFIRSRFAQLALGGILAIRELPSRDLVLVTDTPSTKVTALKRQKDWLYVVGDHAAVRPQKFTVMAHGVSLSAFDNEKQDEGLIRLHESNPSLRNRGAGILRFHWRQRALKLKKSYSSLLLDIESASGANALIREGLVLDNEIKDVELFDPACLITRCYRCQKYGHNAKFCKATERCSLCAAPGHGRTSCPKATSHSHRACVNCTGRHASGSSECPEHKTQARRARDAVAQKPRFFREPDSQPSLSAAPVFAPVQTNWTPQATTSAEIFPTKKRRMAAPPRGEQESAPKAYDALAKQLAAATPAPMPPSTEQKNPTEAPTKPNPTAGSPANAMPDIEMCTTDQKPQ